MTNLQEFIEDRIWDIKRVFNDMKYWISHRTYDKYHVVRTGLPVGYSDFVEKMLHTNFTMLVDFIEVEKAWLNHICHGTPHPFPWWQRKFRKFRSAPDGLDYLYWECHLDVSDVGHSQREAAIEQRELYRWWIDIRPNRDDPDEVSGWTTFNSMCASKGINKEMRKALKISSKIEAQYAKEDEAMLIRLMKIRLSLWT